MRTRELKVKVYEFDKLSELSAEDQDLLLAAREVANSAYAPYSKFKVGAAVLLENGEVIKGSNQENADFTDGLCAERVAVFYANSAYPNIAVKSIAVTAQNAEGELEFAAQPCGSCRQVLVESEVRYKTQIHIIMDGKNRIQVVEGAESLLPLAFKPDALH